MKNDKWCRILIVACWLVPAACRTAPSSPTADRSAPPAGINERFLDPALDAEDWVRRWEVESREIYASRAAVVGALRLRPGERIADVGSGTGLFVEPFSKAVGNTGKVYAVDIAPRFVEHVGKRARQAGLNNVETVLSLERSAELPPRSVDVVFLCDTYHHFDYPQGMLSSIKDALRTGGRLVVIDFERIPGQSREWILNHVRAGKAQVRQEIEQAGFLYDREITIPGFSENYFIEFKKRPA